MLRVREHFMSISLEGGDVGINGIYHNVPLHQVRCGMLKDGKLLENTGIRLILAQVMNSFYFFVFFPVQQSTSGIGHRAK